MPTTRRRIVNTNVEVGPSEAQHLLWGDCLMQCALGDRLAERRWPSPVCILRVAQARQVWADHREWLLSYWNTKPTYDYENRPGDMPGPYPYGWAGVRSFGEIWFDGVKMGPYRDNWPERGDFAYRMIYSRVEALKQHLRNHPQ